MLKEITVPDGYTGTISEENSIVSQINDNFFEIEKMILDLPDDQIVFQDHITDFEQYQIDVYFSDNKKSFKLIVDDNNIVLQFKDKEIRLDSDGNIQ